jgi:photosystem II stability/assembly factor-like uncharacterized protein
MKWSDRSGRRWSLPLAVLALVAAGGCRGEEEWAPLAEQKVYVSDRFYDVAALDEKSAIVIGYDGKALHTADFGATWNTVEVGTEDALFSIGFAPGNRVGWIVGQEAAILKTTDAGKSWTKQGGGIFMTDECRESGGDPDATDESNECPLAPLFALSVVSENMAVAVGDRSAIIVTRDGGQTWDQSTLRPEVEGEIDENAMLAFEDPVLYDVHFINEQVGFVVGEFGKILKTVDGGKTFLDKQGSLVGDEYFDIMELPTFFNVTFQGENLGYVAGLEGRVARTTDGGETWEWVQHGVDEFTAPMYALDIKPDGSVWSVGASGQVLHAPVGGVLGRGTFGTQVTNWIRQVEFYDNNIGWVVGGFGFIMNTSDGGKTWFRRIG